MEDFYPKRPIEYLKSNFEQILKTLDILFNISFSMAQINMGHAYCQLNKMEYALYGTFDNEIIEEKDFRLGKHDTFFSLSICNFEIDGDLINENGIKFQMDEVIIEFIFDMVIPKITILKLRVADFTPSDPNITSQKLTEISDKIIKKLTEITNEYINEREIGSQLEKMKREAIKESMGDIIEILQEKTIEMIKKLEKENNALLINDAKSLNLLEQKSKENENITEK